MTYLIKFSKVCGVNTQQVCGCSTREQLRECAKRVHENLRRHYAGRYAVKREFCTYYEADGVHKGIHFTLL